MKINSDTTINPLTIEDCDHAEEIVLWSYRRWVHGLRHNAPHLWSQVWNDFAVRFGSSDGKVAISGLACCVKTMQFNARRAIAYYPPCCRFIATDEVSFIQFVGACQGADHSLSRIKAEWLVCQNGIGDLLDGGKRLSSILSTHGLFIRNRIIADGK